MILFLDERLGKGERRLGFIQGELMRRVILLVILVVLALKGYERYSREVVLASTPLEPVVSVEEAVPESPAIDVRAVVDEAFACDGRTYCSQMKSCEEAMYFLQNCPNVKMDGNNDGIPCERQWCK
jgi:hypothetical protein